MSAAYIMIFPQHSEDALMAETQHQTWDHAWHMVRIEHWMDKYIKFLLLVSPPINSKPLAEVSAWCLRALCIPVIIIPVSPVVSVAAVLVIRSLSGQVVGSVAP